MIKVSFAILSLWMRCINRLTRLPKHISCLCITVTIARDSTSALSVKYRGVSGYYVCSDQWTSAVSDAVCRQLGYPWVSAKTALLTRVLAGDEIFLWYRVIRRSCSFSARERTFINKRELRDINPMTCTGLLQHSDGHFRMQDTNTPILQTIKNQKVQIQ